MKPENKSAEAMLHDDQVAVAHSTREGIAKNIMEVLGNQGRQPRFAHVTREPFDFNKLSNAQFPAVLVRSSSENREDQTMGGSRTRRSGTIEYQLVCYVKSQQIDTARNEVIQVIEEVLDEDRTRGGHAINTQVMAIETDDGSIDPIGGVIITVACIYQFIRGAT